MLHSLIALNEYSQRDVRRVKLGVAERRSSVMEIVSGLLEFWIFGWNFTRLILSMLPYIDFEKYGRWH